MIQTVPNTVSTNAELVAAVQRGLASLGFLYGQVDGVAGEGTAKAIRNFEVYYNYEVTGEVTPELVRMLRQAGAAI
jgi:peptidoglycan hydrolase-like protein with peptidoglycan-binding domain